MQKITFAPYDADFKLLEQEVKDKQMVGLPSLIREIVGNWCVEKRASKRHTMPVHHYSRRNADDYSEAE